MEITQRLKDMEMEITQPHRLKTLPSEPQPITPHNPSPPTFHLFPHLPTELRLKIWGKALEIPRLITISLLNPKTHSPHPLHSTNTQPPFEEDIPPQPPTTIHRDVNSPLLNINRESRTEALRYYSSPLISRVTSPLHPDGGVEIGEIDESWTRGVYWGPGDDLIYISGCHYDSTAFTKIVCAAQWVRGSANGGGGGGIIRKVAIEEAFLEDEMLFGGLSTSPALGWVFSGLRPLDVLFVVQREGRGKGKGRGTGEVVGMIGRAKERLVEQCEIWGYRDVVRYLVEWGMPEVRVVDLQELREFCG